MDLIWGEGFEREGLGERGGHGRVRERELGARERESVCVVVRVRERFKCCGAQNHQLELDRSDQ